MSNSVPPRCDDGESSPENRQRTAHTYGMRRMKTFEVVLEDGTVVYSKLESQRYPDGEVMRCTAVVLGGKPADHSCQLSQEIVALLRPHVQKLRSGSAKAEPVERGKGGRLRLSSAIAVGIPAVVLFVAAAVLATRRRRT